MDILASWVVHMTVTLLLYTCIRIPMLYLLILGLLNSVVFELFVHFSRGKKTKKVSLVLKLKIRRISFDKSHFCRNYSFGGESYDLCEALLPDRRGFFAHLPGKVKLYIY